MPEEAIPVLNESELQEWDRGILWQTAAAAGSETKRIIPVDSEAIYNEEYRTLIINGLANISMRGQDYETAKQARAALDEHFPGAGRALTPGYGA